MKFVKGVSLFFIYPMVMFCVGFLTNLTLSEYFYPGDTSQNSALLDEVAEEKAPVSAREEIETGAVLSPILNADTTYIVLSYDSFSGNVKESKETPPGKYIGLTREELVAALQEYEKSPSLEDKQNGFQSAQVLSFSPQRVVIRKNYEKKEAGFYIVCEDHQIIVYDKSLTDIYMKTGISMESLPFRIQREIIHMKYVKTEDELYRFLESYSS